MKFPLTNQLVDEARRYHLRSACRDCFFWRGERDDEVPAVKSPR